jgi:hypothetical protein
VLDVSRNPLSELPIDFASTVPRLRVLRIADCKLRSLPELPALFSHLDASGNRLDSLPPLPVTIYELDLSRYAFIDRCSSPCVSLQESLQRGTHGSSSPQRGWAGDPLAATESADGAAGEA